jgi:uncharacterized protein
MRRSLLASACLLMTLAASNAFADDASKAAKVEEFFKLAHLDDVLRQTLGQVRTQMQSGIVQQIFGQKPLPPEMQKQVDDFQNKIADIVSDALSWEKLEPGYVKIYMDAFSEQEIDGIIAFYKSPAGQAMVAKTPTLLTKGVELAQQKIAVAQPALEQLIKDFAAQAAKQPQ